MLLITFLTKRAKEWNDKDTQRWVKGRWTDNPSDLIETEPEIVAKDG